MCMYVCISLSLYIHIYIYIYIDAVGLPPCSRQHHHCETAKVGAALACAKTCPSHVAMFRAT